jgi:hypothetical protein
VLRAFGDLREFVESHACAEPAQELFGSYPAEAPPFLDAEWLEPIRAGTR